MGPKKISLLADFISSVTYMLLGDFPMLLFTATPLIPALMIEFVLYPLMPWLDVPQIEWAKITNLEQDSEYKGYIKGEVPLLTPLY